MPVLSDLYIYSPFLEPHRAVAQTYLIKLCYLVVASLSALRRLAVAYLF